MATQDVELSPASIHPTESGLERFMRGELTRSEARTVVRHLLAGCASCRAATRRLWRFGDHPGERQTDFDQGGSSLMTDIEAAQTEIREILRALKPLKFRLLGVAASLPPSPSEISPLPDVEPADRRTELRSVVECVVNDSLSPAIRDLDEVAGRESS